ncbi:MAG: hypothetical protein LIO46_02525, partial [Clostridiales bacterium]|nr:hypothetical protein [Clostridiales bacterium]
MKRWFTSPGANLAVSCLLFALGVFSTLYLFLSSFSLPHTAVILGVCLAAGALFIVLSEALQGRTRRIVLLVLTLKWQAAGELMWRPLSTN